MIDFMDLGLDAPKRPGEIRHCWRFRLYVAHRSNTRLIVVRSSAGTAARATGSSGSWFDAERSANFGRHVRVTGALRAVIDGPRLDCDLKSLGAQLRRRGRRTGCRDRRRFHAPILRCCRSHRPAGYCDRRHCRPDQLGLSTPPLDSHVRHRRRPPAKATNSAGANRLPVANSSAWSGSSAGLVGTVLQPRRDDSSSHRARDESSF